MSIVKIDVPDLSEPLVEVTLSGKSYLFRFHYSNVEDRYYLDISYKNVPVVSGLKLLEAALTLKQDLPEFKEGNLFLVPLQSTTEPPSRNNIGVGKPYELIYIPNN